jgi:predicted RNA-binding protein with PUA-like domain
MKYWLMKSEPEDFSIDDLKKNKKTLWTGVRNYQARNFMTQEMQKGDAVVFYHSNAEPSGIAGLASVSSEKPVADPLQFDSKSDIFSLATLLVDAGSNTSPWSRDKIIGTKSDLPGHIFTEVEYNTVKSEPHYYDLSSGQ